MGYSRKKQTSERVGGGGGWGAAGVVEDIKFPEVLKKKHVAISRG